MVKKFILGILIVISMIPILVSASSSSEVMISGKYYDSLEEAIKNASSTDTIKLISNVSLDETLEINKTVNIDLNGHNITASSKVFQVRGGVLNVTGKGTIRETSPNYGAIMVVGSSDPGDSNYSIVNIGKDVTLEGWSGIFISHDNAKSYGVVVNLEGKIKAVDDMDGGTGIGVYVNGNIKDQSLSPVVNIKDGAEIVSSGNGLYIAGYSTFNIGKAYIAGEESGIGIKSGRLNIDGATVECTGEDNTPTEGYNNGMKASGTAIQIESNSGYAGDMDINIDSGTFKSKDSNVIYEYIGGGNVTQVNDINILGGTFKSGNSKNVFLVSDSFKDEHGGFVAGGKFSTDPSSYLKSGYTSVLDNGVYTVTRSTMKELYIDGSSSSSGDNVIKVVIGLGIIIIFGIVLYFNRVRIIELFKKNSY